MRARFKRGVTEYRRDAMAARRSFGMTVLFVVVTSCGTNDQADVVAVPDPKLPTLDAAELFEGKLPTFELKLLDTSWAKFRANGYREEYSPAALHFNGKYVGEIAVRVKGQYSIETCYPDGELICDKLSLRLKFDAQDEDRRFFGLKRLSFHALERDVSHLRERLAYNLFREMDIPASRSSWATLVVDGASQGLYAMVEEVDGVFTDDRFDKHGDGDLYKEVWPTSTDPEFYRDGLETNEETADPSKVVAFAQALTESEDAAKRLEVLGKYMDLDALSRYMAVDDAVANWDGVTTFYYDHGGNNHNFFLYADEAGQTPPFVLIPWDMDNTFQAANWRTRAPGWREQVTNCDLVNGVYPPSCDPLLSALLLDQERYTAAANRLLDGPFAKAELDAQIDLHAAFIENAVGKDPFGPSPEAWNADIAELKRNLGLLREQLEVFARGETVRRTGIEPDQMNNFDDVTQLEAELGTSVYAADGVTSQVTVIKDGELSGLRLAFELPESDYGAWVSFALAFPAGEADLSEKTGIRFRAKGKSLPSYARLRVESSASKDPSFAWGWVLSVDGSVETHELRFDDLVWSEEGVEPPTSVEAWLEQASGLSVVLAGEPGKGELELDDVEFF